MTLLINKETKDALPIRHLSVSAIRNFLTNEQDFFKKYVRLEFDNSTSPALMVGKSVHAALESFYNEIAETGEILSQTEIENVAIATLDKLQAEAQKMGLLKLAESASVKIPQKIDTKWVFADLSEEDAEAIPEYKKEAMKAIFEIDEICDRLTKKEISAEEIESAKNEFIQWGKTGSYEDCVADIKKAVKNYFDFMPNYTPLHIEANETVEFLDMEGTQMPLPLKWVIDLIATDESGDLVIIDHKIVSSFSDPEVDQAGFEMQAGAYFFIAQAITGQIPKRMIFDEILKSEAKVICKADPTRKLLQADLKELADANGLTYEKYVKNAELIEMLLNAWVLEYMPTRKPYIIDYAENPQIIDVFLNIYKAIINRLAIMALYELPFEFLPNPFDRLTGAESWKDYKETMNVGTNWQQAARTSEVLPDELDF